MTERTTFEQLLADGLQELAGPVRAVDARAIAERTATRARAEGRTRRPLWWIVDDRRLVLAMRVAVALVALVIAGLIVAAAGLLLRRDEVLSACGAAAYPSRIAARLTGNAPAWVTGPNTDGDASASTDTIVAVERVGADAGSLVLIDTGAEEVCRLVSAQALRSTEGPDAWAMPVGVRPAPTGTAMALSLPGKVLVWSDLGLVRVWPPDGPSDGDPSATFYAVAWAPDARTLAISETNSIEGVIELVSVDGSPRPRLVFDTGILGMAWSPDGTRIAVTQVVGDWETAITLVDVASGTRQALIPRIDPPRIVRAWRDDGMLVVKRVSPTLPDRVQLVPVDAPQDLIDGASPVPQGAQTPHRSWISPDGRSLAFVTQWPAIQDLSIVDALTGLRVGPVGKGVAGDIDSDLVSWAPDSRRLAFTTAALTGPSVPTAVWIVNVDGTGLRQVAGAGFRLLDGAWIGGVPR